MGHDVQARTGVAAGVPYVALPPPGGDQRAPVVLVWHMMDPPRTEAAMAAALPLAAVPAWRVYLGLPLFGGRTPEGGAEEVMRRGASDYVRELFEPVVGQAAEELPAALAALRAELPLDDGPVGLVGGSAGAAVALLVLAGSDLPVAAAALVSPVVQLAPVVAAGERRYGVTYPWDQASRAVAERFDFVARAAELAGHDPQPAVLLVNGERDDPQAFHAPVVALRDALAARSADPARVRLVTVPEMGHELAEEPGVAPAPQTAQAARVDAEAGDWLRRHLPG